MVSALIMPLDTARREWRAAVLFLRRQFLAQPRHRAVEMMQIEPRHAGNRIVLTPAIRRPVGAADEQAVRYGEDHGPLQSEFVSACAGNLAHHLSRSLGRLCRRLPIPKS
jgi:hypothetical protein